jgi:succinate-acetate transporter protein
MNITNTTVQNKELIGMFQTRHAKRVLVPIIAIFGAIFILASFFNFMAGDIYRGFGFIIFGGLWMLLFWGILKLQQRKINKSSPLANEVQTHKYIFADQSVIVEFSSASLTGKQIIPYTTIYKVIAEKDFMFMYVSAIQAFIVDAKGYTEGSYAGLIDFLRTQLLPKKLVVKF